MPPLPPAPQVVKLELGGTYHDTQWLNIWYVHYTGSAPSNSDLSTALSTWDAVFDANYSAEMSVDNEITSLKATDLTTSSGSTAETALSTFGVRTGDFQGANVCMVGSLEIVRRYRGGHPRKYLPWGTAGTMASGSTKDWDSAFVADCNTKFADILAGIKGFSVGSTTFDQVVNVSYRSGNAPRAAAVIDTVVDGIIRTRICSQRRRLGKVGG